MPRLRYRFEDLTAPCRGGWDLTSPCLDCGWDTQSGAEFYMVESELWRRVVPEDATAPGMTVFLCVGCLEARLGRTLTARDFMDVPLNDPAVCRHSARLRDRLRGGRRRRHRSAENGV